VDIRTKLVFALVVTALGSMLALGAFSHEATRDLLQGLALRELEAVAEGKKQDLQRVIAGWQDRVQLVASRTSLRESVRELRLDGRGDAAVLDRIQTIADDAVASTRTLLGISVYTSAGFFVTSSGVDLGDRARVRPILFMDTEQPVVFDYVTLHPEEGLLVSFVAPMRMEGRLVGALKVRISARELIDVTEDYTGLGATGETLMAQLTEEGGALVLNPVRHGPDAIGGLVVPEDRIHDPTLHAARGVEAIHREDATDYRGEAVWAATRYLETFGWGIVVKIDAAEELAPVARLRETMVRLGLSLSAFAILTGTLLGFYISRPIRELAEVVRRFGEGDTSARAEVSGDDEVALLARSFNEMADGLPEGPGPTEAGTRRPPWEPKLAGGPGSSRSSP
jgi:HAMP domain-containing protein